MTELDEIYGRMLTFMGEMGDKYEKLKPLTTELSRAPTLDIFPVVFRQQPETSKLIDAFCSAMDNAVQIEATKLIDLLLTQHGLTRDMFEDSEADFKKLMRYIVLWGDVIFCNETD